MAVKKVYFVRHGETIANIGGYYQSPEVSLSEKGFEGARALAKRCEHLDIDGIIASPYTRAQQTALCISKLINVPVVTFEYIHEVVNAKNMWGERYQSDAGHAYEAQRESRFIDASWNPDGAENYFNVSKRVETAVTMLEESQCKSIVLVSHGNFLRFLVARLLLQKNDIAEPNLAVRRCLSAMSNVGITEFNYEEGEWRLFTWNDHAHFAE